MAIESLLDALSTDADRDVRQIADAARDEAARIRAESEALVSRRCNAALAAHEAELRLTSDARRARARHGGRVQALRAREAFLDRVFSAAAAQLPLALDAPQRADALQQLVADALEYVRGHKAVVRCRHRLAARLQATIGALGTVQLVADDAVPEGVVIEAADGSVTIDNTLVARLQWQRSHLAIALLHHFETSA